MADRAHLERLTRELTDAGKLMEAGWISLRLAAVPPDASAVQLTEMRTAFFAGAHHLFNSVMTMWEPEAEVTDNDMRRMDLIHKELDAFIVGFKAKHGLDDAAPKPAQPEREPDPGAAETMARMERGQHDYGDAPVEDNYRQQMIAIMQTLDEFVNGEAKGPDRPNAIVVMMFPFGTEPGRCNYMSNGVSRADMIVLMKEMTARFEGQPAVSGRA